MPGQEVLVRKNMKIGETMKSTISILFFGRSKKEDLWEYDYILNDILDGKEVSPNFLYLDDIRSGNEKFDVFVYSARDPNNYPWGYMPTFDEVLECIKKTEPKIVIQLSDEFWFEDLQIHNTIANHCDLFLRQYHHKDYSYSKNTKIIPIGYYNGFGNNSKILKIEDRKYSWSFVGEKKTDRVEMIENFNQIPNNFCHLRIDDNKIPQEKLEEIYLNSIFVPCGRGYSSLYVMRIYEACIYGAIPVVVGSVEEVEETFCFEENPPWIFSDSWNNAVEICKELLKDLDKLQEMQDNLLRWWNNRIGKIQEKVNEVLISKTLPSKVVKIDSNIMPHIYTESQFGENWFGYPILYSNMVKKFSSGSKFVEVGSWKGKSAAYMAVEIANSNKDIEFYCVDTWEGSVEHEGMQELPKLYDIFLSNMKPLEKHYFPLKISSLDAVKKFKDESLDFVFIDASHEYDDVKKDIEAWLPKIKSGGILAGHDYYSEGTDWFPGVKQAVNEILDEFDCSENCWIYYKEETNKLKNFPSINFISIEESEDRRKFLYQQFEKYGLTNITPHIYKRYNNDDHKIIEGPLKLHSSGRGPVTSHLKAIKEWYENTDEPYTFFCEDDLSFESVKYWNFTWSEFFSRLPSDWSCIQLCLVREEMFLFSDYGSGPGEIRMRPRCYDDWSGCAYLISRKHAKNLIENYYPNDSIILEYRGIDIEARTEQQNAYYFILPQIENLIYSYFVKGDHGHQIYSFPLFLENANMFESTWSDRFPGNVNEVSYFQILEWWKNVGKDMKLEQLIRL